ncbi:hypothetical protein MZE46_022130 [Pseudomonas sp. A4]|uniref:hypothetical protein n=1 Tax=Pseudomonas sp. S11A4 TaxID=1476791 RepID=UPI00215B7B33|nr:hypothetical protein [Pseudomonas sp. S11A4]MCR8934394.1 hypothetical protein [Pseudomonas sp. S11A4]
MPLKNGPRLEDSPGELDKTFATAGQIEIEQRGTANAITSDSEARLLLALQENNGFVLSRYGVDGEKDGDFKETHWNFEDGDVSTPTRVLLQEDNKIVLIGRSLKNGIERAAVTRFNSNGSPDLVFGRRVLPVPDNTVTPRLNYKFVDGCLKHGNKILVCACHKSGPLEVPLSRVYCLMGNGEPDETFGSDGGFINIMLHDQPSYVTDVQIQHDGKIIVAGSWTYSGKSKEPARWHATRQRAFSIIRSGVRGMPTSLFLTSRAPKRRRWILLTLSIDWSYRATTRFSLQVIRQQQTDAKADCSQD